MKCDGNLRENRSSKWISTIWMQTFSYALFVPFVLCCLLNGEWVRFLRVARQCERSIYLCRARLLIYYYICFRLLLLHSMHFYSKDFSTIFSPSSFFFCCCWFDVSKCRSRCFRFSLSFYAPPNSITGHVFFDAHTQPVHARTRFNREYWLMLVLLLFLLNSVRLECAKKRNIYFIRRLGCRHALAVCVWTVDVVAYGDDNGDDDDDDDDDGNRFVDHTSCKYLLESLCAAKMRRKQRNERKRVRIRFVCAHLLEIYMYIRFHNMAASVHANDNNNKNEKW